MSKRRPPTKPTYEGVSAHLVREGSCLVYDGRRNHHGYGVVGDGTPKRVHVIVWEHHNGPVPDGMVVRHSCDNPPCARLSHLSIGTKADNSADMVERGRSNRGVSRPAAKLTEDEVRAIRRDTRIGRVIAAEYGITNTVVYRIKNGTGWKHVEDK